MEIDLTLRSFLKLLILPPGGLFLLMIVGWMFGKHALGRLFIFLGFSGLYLLTLPISSIWLARQIETTPATQPETISSNGAQAILVFMADSSSRNPEYGGAAALSALSLQRINYALHLHRKTALPLILSGGAIKKDQPALAELGQEWLRQQAGIEPLAIDTESKTTWQNARFSARLIEAHDLQRVALVTHAFHMPRAHYSAQANGIDAIPAPFGFIHRSGEHERPAGFSDWLPHPTPLATNYLLMHELVGQIWYRWVEN